MGLNHFSERQRSFGRIQFFIGRGSCAANTFNSGLLKTLIQRVSQVHLSFELSGGAVDWWVVVDIGGKARITT